MDVSIIIVNYKTVSLISNCIYSIIKYVKDIEYEIIVVDNNSMDNYEYILQKEFGNKIRCVSLSQNIGFGRANNEGFKIAKGRNIFCLNPDTVLINNAVKILSDYLDNNPCVGACGGNLFDENMKPALSFRRILPSIKWEINQFLNNIPEKILFKNRYFNFSGKPMSVGYITGADIMIKNEVIKEMKGFCPDFFMYYEDTDLCYRIKENGYKIISVSEAQIQHLEGKSFNSEQINTNRITLSEEGRLLYYKRNSRYLSVVDCIYKMFLYSRILCFTILNYKKSLHYKTRLECYKNLQKNIKKY